MVTGGLGFIGSNLAHRLVALGADVLLVDSLIDGYGGHLFNIEGIRDRVRVNVADVRDASTMNYLVRDRQVIFNLAGQVSHIDSIQDPHTDLEINCRSQLTILEACRHFNPNDEGRFRRHAPGLRQGRTSCRSRKRIWCGRPTSTASTRRRARTITSSTTTCTASAHVRCG